MKKRLSHMLGILCWALLLPTHILQASEPVDPESTDPTVETEKSLPANPFSPSKASPDEFAFPGITVDITATSANEARLKGMEDAQNLAFQNLIATRVPEKMHAGLKNFSAPQIEKLVQDIEVEKEKYSDVRYVATFKVTFKADALRNLLGDIQAHGDENETSRDDVAHNNAAPTVAPLPGRATVVVPVFLLDHKKLLWEEHNPWFQAFANAPTPSPLLVVPTGDLTDISVMGLSRALNPSADLVETFAMHHEAPQVVVAIIQEKEKGEPTLEMTLYGNGKRLTHQVKPLLPSGNLEATLKSAVQMVADFVKDPPAPQDFSDQEDAQGDTSSHTNLAGHTLEAQVVFDSLKEWLSLKKHLELVPGVRSVIVKKLARRTALVHIQTSLSSQALTTTLTEEGVSVTSMPDTPLLKIQVSNTPPPFQQSNTSTTTLVGEPHELS